MSLLSAIDYLMKGIGLKEAFSTIFAENAVEKILSGHAFSRAIRGHFLNFVAFCSKIFSTSSFTEEEENLLDSYLNTTNFTENDFIENPTFLAIVLKFKNQFTKLKANGPTAKLFTLYLEIIIVIFNFYNAERSGNFELHLDSVKKMIPIFYATGHNNYAKSTTIYYQDMTKLKEVLTPEEYQMFVIKGFFTIRRTNKFWSGVWTDMCIEQDLMRILKIIGGLTQGRHFNEGKAANFLSNSVTVLDICRGVETFCSYVHQSGEQHVDSRASRISRDQADIQKLIEFYDADNPFPSTEQIISITSGLIGNWSINCFKAYEIGIDLYKLNIGKKVSELKFQRKNRVLPLIAMNSKVQINNNVIPIKPLLIFQRFCLNMIATKNIETFLQLELAPFSLSIFDESDLRKTNKSSFIENFNKLEIPLSDSDFTNVVDGGFFIHQISWTPNEPTESVLRKYIQFAKKNFKPNSTIVFDDYENMGTKYSERCRHQKTCSGREINVAENSIIPIRSEEFLNNDKNKKSLIELLVKRLNSENFRSKVADEDADSLIVSIARKEARFGNRVQIIGNDTDL